VVDELDRQAKLYGVSRSIVIRWALEAFARGETKPPMFRNAA
jgi:hypothetical protein